MIMLSTRGAPEAVVVVTTANPNVRIVTTVVASTMTAMVGGWCPAVVVVIPDPAHSEGQAKADRVIRTSLNRMMLDAESMFAKTVLIQIET